MYRLVRLSAALFAGALTLAAVCVTAGGQTVVREQEFRVQDRVKISAESDNASFRITTGPAGIVRVTSTLANANLIDYFVTSSVVSDRAPDLHILARVLPGALNRARSEIELQIPPGAFLAIDTTAGSVDIAARLSGTTRIATTNAKVTLVSAAGDYDISTTNGDVRLESVAGTFRVSTTNGDVLLDGAVLDSRSSRLETTFGSIDVQLRGTPSLRIEASNQNGELSAEGLASLVAGEGFFRGTAGDGDALLELVTRSGPIAVRR